MDLSIIIVNWNSSALLQDCLASIEQWVTDLSYEAIIVDNCSKPDDVRFLVDEVEPRFSWAKLIYNKENVGFARANNQGLKSSSGKYVLLLNPDTCLIGTGFEKLFKAFEGDGIGMVSCKLLNADLTTQISCFYFPRLARVFFTSLMIHKILPRGLRRKLAFSPEDHKEPQSPDWVLGAFMLLRRKTLQQVEGFDECIFMYGEDMDLCYRVRELGLEILHLPDYAIIHYGGCSGSQAWSDAKKESMTYQAIFRFYRTHLGKGQLLLARIFYSIGALLRICLYSLSSLLPGRRERGLNEVRTQWAVLLTQLDLYRDNI